MDCVYGIGRNVLFGVTSCHDSNSYAALWAWIIPSFVVYSHLVHNTTHKTAFIITFFPNGFGSMVIQDIFLFIYFLLCNFVFYINSTFSLWMVPFSLNANAHTAHTSIFLFLVSIFFIRIRLLLSALTTRLQNGTEKEDEK